MSYITWRETPTDDLIIVFNKIRTWTNFIWVFQNDNLWFAIIKY